MNTVTQNIQTEIKKLSVESHAILLRIITLKWGSLENARRVGEIRAIREPEGAPARRAEVKKLHQPKTGPERSALWADKRELKDKIRHLLLAYAFLRGRPYAQQEPVVTKAPSISWVESIIEEFGGTPPAAEAIKAWVETKVETGAAVAAPVAA